MPGSVLDTLYLMPHNTDNAGRCYFTQFTEEQTEIYGGEGTTQDCSTKVVALLQELTSEPVFHTISYGNCIYSGNDGPLSSK